MSHEIYTTKAFVISSENTGESDKTFFLFTKDLGLVRGRADGIRKLSSKLRFVLSDFAFCEVSFVAGKHGWKIVNSAPIHDFFPEISKSESKVKVLRLLKKVCPQDEPDEFLFNEILNGFLYLEKNTETENKNLEALLLMKVLSRLGYWADQERFDFVKNSFEKQTLETIEENKKEIIKELNKSLRATQLV